MAELRTPQGHTLLLPEGCVSIGADPGCEVPVAVHLGLAPVHFRLQPWEGGHFLEDAGSGLGTLVNGHPVNWKPLTHGDIIAAGGLEVVYHQQSSGATHAVPVIVAPASAPIPAPASLMIRPLALPSSAGIPSLGFQPLSPPPAISAPLPPAHLSSPPAWLPNDLLPEAYQVSHPSTADFSPPPHPQANPSSRTSPASYRPTPLRKILPIAALLAILGWAGHFAWQRGHLSALLHNLRTAPTSTEAPLSPPSTDPTSPPLRGDARIGSPPSP